MSTQYKTKTDSLNELITNMAEFNNMKEHLISNKDLITFIRWFDKLRMYDARSTWLYLADNKDKLTVQQIRWAEKTYKRKLER